MNRITILVAEDHMVVREGLKLLLEAGGDMEVVAEAEDGRQAVELAQKLRPAVVLMDLAMPLVHGLEATRQIHHAGLGAKVLILSAYSDPTYVERAKAAGAAGYVLKESTARTLVEAVREVAHGNTVFHPAASEPRPRTSPNPARRGSTPSRNGDPPTPLRRGVELSPRETQVFALIARGKATKEVGAELGVSYKTADNIRQRLMAKLRKLDICGVAGLTRHAIARGIISAAPLQDGSEAQILK